MGWRDRASTQKFRVSFSVLDSEAIIIEELPPPGLVLGEFLFVVGYGVHHFLWSRCNMLVGDTEQHIVQDGFDIGSAL